MPGFLPAQWDPWFLPQGVAVRTPGGAVRAWRTDTETLGRPHGGRGRGRGVADGLGTPPLLALP